MREFTAIVRIPESYIWDDSDQNEDLEALKSGNLSFQEFIDLANNSDDVTVEYSIKKVDDN